MVETALAVRQHEEKVAMLEEKLSGVIDGSLFLKLQPPRTSKRECDDRCGSTAVEEDALVVRVPWHVFAPVAIPRSITTVGRGPLASDVYRLSMHEVTRLGDPRRPTARI